MKNIRCVVYASSASYRLATAELEVLLADARAFNHEHQITGVLLHSGAHFMQCLEGAPQDVAKAYERIQRSSQHQDIVEYMDDEIAKRTFTSWDMGVAQINASELLTLSTAEWSRTTQQPASFDSPVGLKLLNVFWNMRPEAA
jgi:hypothetical protein